MLHHLELYVTNLTRSLRFWEPFLGQLGYQVSQRWSDGISFVFGGTYLCFVQAPAEHLEVGYHRKRVGLNHLAFHAASRDQVDALTQWVKSEGFACLYEARHPHAGGRSHYALYCEDPDRIKVELVAPAEA